MRYLGVTQTCRLLVLAVYSWTGVPLAVAPPVTSRTLPDAVCTIWPLAADAPYRLLSTSSSRCPNSSGASV